MKVGTCGLEVKELGEGSYGVKATEARVCACFFVKATKTGRHAFARLPGFVAFVHALVISVSPSNCSYFTSTVELLLSSPPPTCSCLPSTADISTYSTLYSQ
jgi:hypothetical protein